MNFIEMAMDLVRQIIEQLKRAQAIKRAEASELKLMKTFLQFEGVVEGALYADKREFDAFTASLGPVAGIAKMITNFEGPYLEAQQSIRVKLKAMAVQVGALEVEVLDALADLEAHNASWGEVSKALAQVPELIGWVSQIPGWSGSASGNYGTASNGQGVASTQLAEAVGQLPASIQGVISANELVSQQLVLAMQAAESQAAKAGEGLLFPRTRELIATVYELEGRVVKVRSGEAGRNVGDRIDGQVNQVVQSLPSWPTTG